LHATGEDRHPRGKAEDGEHEVAGAAQLEEDERQVHPDRRVGEVDDARRAVGEDDAEREGGDDGATAESE
jgi:hypothetical protein